MKEVFKCPFMDECYEELSHVEWFNNKPVIMFDIPTCKAPVFTYDRNPVCRIAVEDDITTDDYMKAMEKQMIKGRLFNRIIRKIFK